MKMWTMNFAYYVHFQLRPNQISSMNTQFLNWAPAQSNDSPLYSMRRFSAVFGLMSISNRRNWDIYKLAEHSERSVDVWVFRTNFSSEWNFNAKKTIENDPTNQRTLQMCVKMATFRMKYLQMIFRFEESCFYIYDAHTTNNLNPKMSKAFQNNATPKLKKKKKNDLTSNVIKRFV